MLFYIRHSRFRLSISLLKQIINRRDLHFFRLVDDAGDELRAQAYKVLAEIEQMLRAFINQSIVDTEVLGFEWWGAFGETSIPKLEQALKKLPGFKGNAHPLELTTFEDLLQIVTTSVSQWDEQRSMSSADLVTLLEGASDLNDLKQKLEEKLQKFSFWNNVFARYFAGSESQWQSLKLELEFIIQQRNKVAQLQKE